MDEQLLARRAIGGDLNSFGQLYDTYFPRVYDFSWRLLLDAEEAARVTAAVFDEVVRNLHTLKGAPNVRGWLFAIALRHALPRAERRREAEARPQHEEAFGAFSAPDPAHTEDRALLRGDEELPGLVWEAAALLNARDYALLDLHLRQHLDGSDLAAVLAASKSATSNLVTRLERVAGDTFAGYVLARRGGKDCDDLRRTLQSYEFPPYGEDVRAGVETHIAECERCKAAGADMPSPIAVFGALATVEAPLSLKAEIWRNVASDWTGAPSAVAFTPPARDWAGATSDIGRDAERPGGPKPPVPSDGDGQKPWLLFAGAAAGLLLFSFAVGGALMALTGDDDGKGVGAEVETPTVAPPVVETVEVVETPAPGVDVEEPPTPDVPPTATPEPSPTLPPPPPPTNTPPPPPPPPPPATATPNIRTVGPPPSPTLPPAVLPTEPAGVEDSPTP